MKEGHPNPDSNLHPAQVQLVQKDIVVGFWHMTRFSGALPVPRRTAILERIDTLSGRLPRLVGSSDTYPTPVTYFGFGIGGAGTVGGGGGVGGGTGGGGGGGY